jgi:cell division protein FtsI/penicillin-binding protein 2
VTPIQLAAAFNAIANDGLWVPPHVIQQIEDASGSLVPVPGRRVPKRVWPQKHAALMRQLLAAVVSRKGTARRAVIEGVQLAGKTSTVKLLVNGKFDDRKSRCLFSCFGPVEKPAYTCLVLVEQPLHGTRKEQTGGRIAAPIAARIMARLLGATPPHAVEPELRRDVGAEGGPSATARPATPARRKPAPDNDADAGTPRPWMSRRLRRGADRGAGEEER